jgi:hypothetical protein
MAELAEVAVSSQPTGEGLPELERQASWALPEIAPSPCNLLAWGRADLGQTCAGREVACTPPARVEALQSKDIVYAAGSIYNSAFVTRASCPAFAVIAQAMRDLHWVPGLSLMQGAR